MSSPNPGAFYNALYGVTAISGKDVWAVGFYEPNSSGPYQTLIEHWDGTQWSIVKSPTPGGGGALNGVAAVSSSDIWAVGITSSKNQEYKTFTEFYC